MSSHASQHVEPVWALNIRRAREFRGWTQRQLATELDTDTMSVSRWERGKVRPSAQFEAKLVALLFDGDLAALYAEPTPEAA